MFPYPRKLHDLLRRIIITDIRKRGGHLLRFDEEMRRRDIVVVAVRSIRDFQQRALAIAGVRTTVDIDVADRVIRRDWMVAGQEGGSEEVELEGGGGEVHGDDRR